MTAVAEICVGDKLKVIAKDNIEEIGNNSAKVENKKSREKSRKKSKKGKKSSKKGGKNSVKTSSKKNSKKVGKKKSSKSSRKKSNHKRKSKISESELGNTETAETSSITKLSKSIVQISIDPQILPNEVSTNEPSTIVSSEYTNKSLSDDDVDIEIKILEDTDNLHSVFQKDDVDSNEVDASESVRDASPRKSPNQQSNGILEDMPNLNIHKKSSVLILSKNPFDESRLSNFPQVVNEIVTADSPDSTSLIQGSLNEANDNEELEEKNSEKSIDGAKFSCWSCFHPKVTQKTSELF